MQLDADAAPNALLGVQHTALGLEFGEGEREGTVVLMCDGGEGGEDFFVAVLGDEPFRGLHHFEDEEAREGENDDEGAAGEVEVAPAHVGGAGTRRVRRTTEVGHECPGE